MAGATGKFPHGKLNPEDEGQLALAVAYDPQHNIVRIDFGKPIVWMAMTPKEAITFGEMLIAKGKMGAN